MTNDELAAQLRLAADILEGKNAEQKPAFKIPTPPPGMQWHRTDGWTAEMLPQGWRPLCNNETVIKGDEFNAMGAGSFEKARDVPKVGSKVDGGFWHYRTTRPLTFTHSGHEWTWHRAGDPMPCDGDKMVYLMTSLWGAHTTPTDADICLWETNDDNPIIGWRYADVEKPDEIPWIEWHGGECPLKDEEVESFEYKTRIGPSGPCSEPSSWNWSHNDHSGDIIAYRVLKWREKKPLCMTDDKSSIKDNLESIIAAMTNDPEYAWSWHCNIAMAAHDSGASPHAACNRGAALFLKLLSDGRVDTTAHPAYAQTQNASVVKDEKPKKTVPLGPEDVTPGSVLLSVTAAANGTRWTMATCSKNDGVEINGRLCIPWVELKTHWNINRSIPLEGKWNPNAWEPCSKEVDA